MSSTIVKKEKNEVTVDIQISAETFKKGIDTAYKKLRKRFSIPGFRKGKAPKKIIEMNYGKEVFYDEAINGVFPEAYSEAIKEHDLEPVGQPSLDIKDEIVAGQDIHFIVKVTVKPEVKLGEYKGIEVSKKEYNVTDEDVEKEIEQLRERNARLLSVERPIVNGDTVIIDYEGFIEHDKFEGGTAENQTLVIGSGQFIPGFEEKLIGSKPGDEVEIDVTFPEDYHAKDLASQDANFKVKVKEVKEKELPELDDEFAKDVSEQDTLEELRQDIKEKQEKAAVARAEKELKDELVKQATDQAEIDVPEIMVENQIDQMINEFGYQLQFQGLNLDTYLQYTGTKMEEMRAQMTDSAKDRVRTQLTLEAIGKVEKVEAAEEEVEKEVQKYAEQYKMEVEKFKKSLRPEDMENIEDGVKVKKIIDLLVESAKIA